MNQKYIKVTLKEPIGAAVAVEFDFSDPLKASAQVEQLKRNLAFDIKDALLQRITTLHIDDLKFEFIDKPL